MKKLNILFLILVGLFLSGCFEIIEDVTMNEDGSGKFKVILNLSQSKSQITKIMSQDTINGNKVPSQTDINTKIKDIMTKLSNQEGITNLTHTMDFENFIFKASFNFSSPQALNLASQNLIRSENPNADPELNPIAYNWVNHVFSRTFNSELLRQANKDKEKVSKFLGGFENAKLTTIFRFQNEINNVDNQKGKISSSKKNYFQQSTVNTILGNESFQKIQIQTK